MPISPSPVGSGARAAGMADAFVAIADDATAASWNPAGLVQLEKPEISIVGSFNGISEQFHASEHIGFGDSQKDSNFDLNFLSVAYPLPFLVLGRNVVAGLSYQRKYDLSRKFDVSYSSGTYIEPFSRTLLQARRWQFEQEGGLSTITPTIGLEVTPRFSLGIAWNLWRSSIFDDNGWTQKQEMTTGGLLGPSFSTTYTRKEEEYKNFRGDNFSLGFLWNVTDKWNLGGRYDSGFTAKTDYTSMMFRVDSTFASIDRPKGFFSFSMPVVKREKRKIRFPDTLALGAAYRRNDRLTLSMDITRTDWNDFYATTASGRKMSLIDASFLNTMIADMPALLPLLQTGKLGREELDPAYTLRLGAEYLFIPKELETKLDRLWTLRAGLFYDEEPARGHPDTFLGAAIGAGLLLKQVVNFDVAYQIRYGRGVNKEFIRGVDGYEEDVLQHRFLVSAVVYFP